MGLLRMAARTAVVAGTATAVSGRVAHRQNEKYAAQDQAPYDQQQAAYDAGQQAAAPAPAGGGPAGRVQKLASCTSRVSSPTRSSRPQRPRRSGSEPGRGVLAAGRGLRRDRRRPLPWPLGLVPRRALGRGRPRRPRRLLRHRPPRRRARRARLPRRRRRRVPGDARPGPHAARAGRPARPGDAAGTGRRRHVRRRGLHVRRANYLAPGELPPTFAALADRLRPGGWLVFDVHTDAMMDFTLAQPVVTGEADGSRFTISSDVDRAARTCVTTSSSQPPDGLPFEEHHRQWFHADADLRAALAGCQVHRRRRHGRVQHRPVDAATLRRHLARANSSAWHRRCQALGAQLASLVVDGLHLHDDPGLEVLRPRSQGARRASRSRSCRARRSASSARTAPASRRCCGSWPAVEETSSGTAELRAGRDRRTSLGRSRSSTRPRTSAATSRTASATLRDLLDRFDEISASLRRAGRRLRRAARGAGEGAGADRPARRLEPRPQARARDGRAAPARPATATSRPSPAASGGASRSAACCCRRPTSCSSTSRRTTSTPSRSPGSSASSPTTRARSSPSRTTATSSTTSPAGSSSSTAAAASRTRATTPPGSSRSRRGSRTEEKQESARRRALARELEWVRASPAARHAKWKARAQRVRAAARRGAERQARPGRDPHPGRAAARRPRRRGATASAKGFGDRLLVEDLDVLAAARRHRRRHRPERRRQDDALPHDRRRGAARRRRAARSATRSSSPTSTSRAATSTRTNTVWKEISGGHDMIELGPREVNSRQYVSWFNFSGVGPAEARRRPLGRRAQPRPPREAPALGRQPAAARRADERPRRRHAARARGRAARLRRLRGGDLARPLVPRPDRDAHPRLRGRLDGHLVRGQLEEYASGSPPDPRRRGRSSRTGSSTSRSCGRRRARKLRRRRPSHRRSTRAAGVPGGPCVSRYRAKFSSSYSPAARLPLSFLIATVVPPLQTWSTHPDSLVTQRTDSSEARRSSHKTGIGCGHGHLPCRLQQTRHPQIFGSPSTKRQRAADPRGGTAGRKCKKSPALAFPLDRERRSSCSDC